MGGDFWNRAACVACAARFPLQSGWLRVACAPPAATLQRGVPSPSDAAVSAFAPTAREPRSFAFVDLCDRVQKEAHTAPCVPQQEPAKISRTSEVNIVINHELHLGNLGKRCSQHAGTGRVCERGG